MRLSVETIVPAIRTRRHNAFTGLCRYRGYYYLACRSAASHMSETSELTVCRSSDGAKWEPFTRIAGGADRDLRDPKLVVFRDQLWLFAAIREDGALYGRTSVGYRLREDGAAEIFILKGLPAQYWLWSVCVAPDGQLYGSCYGMIEDQLFDCFIVTSDDAVQWRILRKLPWHCGETALDCDGHYLYGLGRVDRTPFLPEYFRMPLAGGPIEHRTLPVVIHGPFLKRLPGGCLLIGRHWIAPEFRDDPSVNMWFLPDGGELQELGPLPSRGDCSYAGYGAIDERQALISYYSSIQAGVDVCHIFVARVTMEQEDKNEKEA